MRLLHLWAAAAAAAWWPRAQVVKDTPLQVRYLEQCRARPMQIAKLSLLMAIEESVKSFNMEETDSQICIRLHMRHYLQAFAGGSLWILHQQWGIFINCHPNADLLAAVGSWIL